MLQEKGIARKIGLIIGPLVFIAILLSGIGESSQANNMAAVAGWMAIWWMTEAIPLGATALLPIILFPFMGIMKGNPTASAYFNSTIFLFMGGFLIALAMEKWNLHKRISLIIILSIGRGPAGIILGFMFASFGMSMFISNVATTVMMLPIGMAVLSKLDEQDDKEAIRNFGIALMLGIAYASSIGGIATLIGTAPNLVFKAVFNSSFPNGPDITFGNWLLFAFPNAIVMLGIAYLVMTKLVFRIKGKLELDRHIIRDEYLTLGKIKYEEKVVLIILLMTGLLWMFRKQIELGTFVIPGWSELLPFGHMIDDGTVAIFTSSLLFLLPAGKNRNDKRIVNHKIFAKIPWEIIILFGGGFALAKGFSSSGLSEYIGQSFSGVGQFPAIIMVIAVCFLLTFLTELTSNTATTQTVLPILASVSIGLGINPLLIMIPATLSASFAFMLPVATPPNAIVFGSGRIRVGDMVKVGIILNILGVLVTSIMFYFLGSQILGIDQSIFPDWAK